MSRTYQICTRCIMDTTDPNIIFDQNGICNHCHECDETLKRQVFSGDTGRAKLGEMVQSIKKSGKGKPYDCLIGVSGGVDSTFLAFKMKQLGLRPLAVHLDNGWDSELAVSNIEKALTTLKIDLHTMVIDWNEFKDLQLAYLYSSTPDSEIPTDHAIVATLFKTAAQFNIKYIVNGQNFSTEAILPKAWSHGHYDWKYIKSIHSRFGHVKLKTFPHYSYLRFLYYLLVKKIKIVFPLNYIDYDKQEAIRILEQELSWRNYGGKHYESKYTHFFQAYILPTKFHFDKRRAHLSTLVCSNQMTRDQALGEINKPLYDPVSLNDDLEFVQKKLGLSASEFRQIIEAKPKKFSDYPSSENDPLYQSLFALARIVRKIIKYE